jgi:hypothetical protein
MQKSAKLWRNYATVIDSVKVGAQRHRKMSLAYFLEAVFLQFLCLFVDISPLNRKGKNAMTTSHQMSISKVQKSVGVLIIPRTLFIFVHIFDF